MECFFFGKFRNFPVLKKFAFLKKYLKFFEIVAPNLNIAPSLKIAAFEILKIARFAILKIARFAILKIARFEIL